MQLRVALPGWHPPLLCLFTCPLVFEVHHDSDGIPETQSDHLLHCVRHGRREEMRPTLFWQMAHDPLDISSVIGTGQQPVRLVQDQAIQIRDSDDRLTPRREQKRREPAWRSYEDVGGQREEGLVWRWRAGSDKTR